MEAVSAGKKKIKATKRAELEKSLMLHFREVWEELSGKKTSRILWFRHGGFKTSGGV